MVVAEPVLTQGQGLFVVAFGLLQVVRLIGCTGNPGPGPQQRPEIVERLCDRILFLRQGELLDEAAALELRRRARRAVRVTWTDSVRAEDLEPRLRATGAEVHTDGARATLFPPEGLPPLDLLRQLTAGTDLPEPESLVYGELSLQEIYRELYGAEGV